MSGNVKDPAFPVFIRFYLTILICLFAAAGLVGLAGLQAGWIVAANGTSTEIALPDDVGDDDAGALSFTQPVTVWSQIFPVDTSITYDMSAEVRSSALDGDPYRGARTYLGVETLDENMRPLRSGPGTYRYAGALNRTIQTHQGWITFEGSITGEGDERHDQFRPGTRFVRVVVLLNYQSEGMRSEVRNVRFGPRLVMEER